MRSLFHVEKVLQDFDFGYSDGITLQVPMYIAQTLSSIVNSKYAMIYILRPPTAVLSHNC